MRHEFLVYGKEHSVDALLKVIQAKGAAVFATNFSHIFSPPHTLSGRFREAVIDNKGRFLFGKKNSTSLFMIMERPTGSFELYEHFAKLISQIFPVESVTYRFGSDDCNLSGGARYRDGLRVSNYRLQTSEICNVLDRYFCALSIGRFKACNEKDGPGSSVFIREKRGVEFGPNYSERVYRVGLVDGSSLYHHLEFNRTMRVNCERITHHKELGIFGLTGSYWSVGGQFDEQARTLAEVISGSLIENLWKIVPYNFCEAFLGGRNAARTGC